MADLQTINNTLVDENKNLRLVIAEGDKQKGILRQQVNAESKERKKYKWAAIILLAVLIEEEIRN